MSIDRELTNRAAAAELEAERGALDWSYDELVEKSGQAYQTVYRALNNKTKVSLSLYFVLCEAMGVAPDEMARRIELRTAKLASMSEARDTNVSHIDEKRGRTKEENDRIVENEKRVADDLDKEADQSDFE